MVETTRTSHAAVTGALRLALFASGVLVVACAVAVMLWNELGPGPLDVFIGAIRARTGLPLSVALWLTVGSLLAIAWLLGRRPGVGSLAGPIILGPLMQVALEQLQRFDVPSSLAVRLVIHLAAVAAVGLGAGAAIVSGLGAGSGELLAAAASDRSGHPEPRMRFMFESTWLVAGAALGGPFGVGTVIVAATIGPAVAQGHRLVVSFALASRRRLYPQQPSPDRPAVSPSSKLTDMEVRFERTGERRYATVIALAGQDPRRTDPAPGYDDDIPHDVVHYLVEAELGLSLGVFGRAAAGGGGFIATTEAPRDPRRRARQQRRSKKREASLSRSDHGDMARSEHVTGLCDLAWRRRGGAATPGGPSAHRSRPRTVPIVARVLDHLDQVAVLWRDLPVGGALIFSWPHTTVRVER